MINKNEKLYVLKILDRCKRDFLKSTKKDTTLRRWVENILEELKLRPFMGERLDANFPGYRSIHFGGNNYRIVYTINEPESEILILGIGHRSSTYSDLARILEKGW